MRNTKPDVLLVNFDQASYSKLEKDRRISSHRGWMKVADGGFKFHFSLPLYECRAAFVNLVEDAPTDAPDEFLDWASEGNRESLIRHLSKGIGEAFVVVFAEKGTVTSLYHLGVDACISGFSSRDSKKTVGPPEREDDFGLMELAGKLVGLPQEQVILDEENYYDDGGCTIHECAVSNNNGDVFAVIFAPDSFYSRHYSGDPYGSDHRTKNQRSNGLVMPPVSDLATATKSLLDWLLEPKTMDDWLDNYEFYPIKKTESLKTKIEEIKSDGEERVRHLEDQISRVERDHLFLKQILTSDGDNLKDAVKSVFEEVLGLNVLDSDKFNSAASKPPAEDLRINLKGVDILVEVKGTIKDNPPPSHFTQIQTNALKQGFGPDAKLCLVVNHSRKLSPPRRPIYVGDENEQLMKDIGFIDTQVLHSVAVDVINRVLTPAQARNVLFGKPGRVQYESEYESRA